MTTKKLATYLVLTFLLSWFFQGLAIFYGVKSEGKGWLFLAMWMPLFAALISGRDARRQLWSLLKKSGWKIWPLALVTGWAFSGGQQLLLSVLHEGHWHTEFFKLSADGTGIDSIRHVGVMLGTEQQGFSHFFLNILLSVALGSIVTMLIGTIGEEGGWRGVLQPEMEKRAGIIKGTFWVGLIWAYWHLPVNLAGLNDSEHPVLQALVIFPLCAISLSFALAWLVRRTNSVWPAALAHAANNVLSAGPLVLPDAWLPEQSANVLVAVLIGAIFAYLLFSETRSSIQTTSSGLAREVIARKSSHS